MKLAGALYLDHQEEIGYYLEPVLRRLGFVDDLYLFGADQEQCKFLKEACEKAPYPNAQILKSGIHINEPNDISKTMRYCFEALRKDYDFVLLCQADTTSTMQAEKFISDFIEVGDTSKAVQLAVFDARLYCLFYSGWGYTLIGKDFPPKFASDGILHGAPMINVRCLHIGYLSVELYRRHLERQSKTWKNRDKHKYLDEASREGFTRSVLRKLREHLKFPLMMADRYSEELWALIAELGLEEEREWVGALAQEINRA